MIAIKRVLASTPILAFTALVLASVVMASWVVIEERLSAPARLRPLQLGQPAPGFQLAVLRQDSALELQGYAGKVVLVEFWASWCFSCGPHLQELQKLHEELAPAGLQVVGITIDSERGWPRAEEIALEFGVDFDLLADPNGQVHRLYGARGVPVFYLIGRRGELLAQSLGVRFERATIEAALAQ